MWYFWPDQVRDREDWPQPAMWELVGGRQWSKRLYLTIGIMSNSSIFMAIMGVQVTAMCVCVGGVRGGGVKVVV